MLRRRLLPEGRPGTWRTLWAGEDADRLADALAELRSPPLFGGPQVLAAALADPQIRAHVGARPVRKVVFVPGRMLNLIV